MPAPAPAATFNDLATDALVLIGEVGAGEPIAPEDGAYCLQRYNAMVQSWNLDRGKQFFEVITAYSFPASGQAFTIGPTGNISAVRPIHIAKARILSQVGGQYVGVKDLDILSPDEWQELSDPTAVALVPEKLYCDFAQPNANIYVYPGIGTNYATSKLELRTWGQIVQYTATTNPLSMPDGLYEALVMNLGVAIGPAYEKPLDQVTALRAKETLDRWMQMNALNAQILPPAPQGPEAQAPGQ